MINIFSGSNLKYNSSSDFIKYRELITSNYDRDEKSIVEELVEKASLSPEEKNTASKYADEFVINIRKHKSIKSGLDAFLLQYDLSSQEGISLMCMAEALLRIPDNNTRDLLIRDKIGSKNWDQHLGKSKALFVNAATYALMLTGKVIKRNEVNKSSLKNTFKKLVERSGEPVIRQAVATAMKILGRQFVMAQTIDKALERAKYWEDKNYTYSYDMLGEAARTDSDAEFYFNEYKKAINVLAKSTESKSNNKSEVNPCINPGISIKLSALDPRYELFEEDRNFNILYPRVLELAKMAKVANIGFTIDAEESERLDISLDIFEKLFFDPEFKTWHGLGLAVQAYQKRAYSVLEYLNFLSKKFNKKIMVRLVKGAYWDREIKFAQVEGYQSYPVFTRKASTDVSYIACAKYLLNNLESFYPQFATHNAYTLGLILAVAKANNLLDSEFEFQRLHGMGENLYEQVVGNKKYGNKTCRIYAPVGGYKHLLAYLVRRLLENGANSSFVNRLIDESLPVSEITKCPVDEVVHHNFEGHKNIKLPKFILGKRLNSSGVNLSNIKDLNNLLKNINNKLNVINNFVASPVIGDVEYTKDLDTYEVLNPANLSEKLGVVYRADINLVKKAIDTAQIGYSKWSEESVEYRAQCLNNMADLLEENYPELIGLLIKEAGKTLKNAISEIREAIDFCRYYAEHAVKLMSKAKILPGPTGEHNQISNHPKGIFVCISPWNFPLAIYLGQIVAALVTGNTVIAKPAEQTVLIAKYALDLLYKAGISKEALQFLPGKGSVVGTELCKDYRITGVIFTGSCYTASIINKNLAERHYKNFNYNYLPTIIAETGGLNGMIVDSSSLPEQVVADVLMSAFDSSGQRCSALRILYVQDDIADSLINMLTGAIKLKTQGNTEDLAIDIGPVIDNNAKQGLLDYINLMDEKAKNKQGVKLIYKSDISKIENQGHFVPLTIYELDNPELLQEEQFGPILHIVRYKSQDIDKVIDYINNSGFGLTFGVHSRIEEFTEYVCSKIKAGNCYVNRNTVGAVVGVQPFGGMNLSGTGPKAGGEHYLTRMITEKTVSIDTTASGGNASLLSLVE